MAIALDTNLPPAIVEKVAEAKAPASFVTVKGSWSDLRGPGGAKELALNQVREDNLLTSLKKEIENFTGGEPRDRSAAAQSARTLLSGLLNNPANDELFFKGLQQISNALKSNNEHTVFYATAVLSNLRMDMHFAGRDGKAMFPKPGLTDISARFTSTIAQDALDGFNASSRPSTVGDLLKVVQGLGPRTAEAEPKMREHLSRFYSRFSMRGTDEKLLCEELIAALDSIGSPKSLAILEKVGKKDSDAEVRTLATKAAEKITVAEAARTQQYIAKK